MNKKEDKNQKEEEYIGPKMGSCPLCGSRKVELITRVTGFFSKINSWNKGKIGELKNRRTAIKTNVGALGGASSVLNKKEEEKPRGEKIEKSGAPGAGAPKAEEPAPTEEPKPEAANKK